MTLRRALVTALAALCAGTALAQVLAPQYPGGFKPQFDEDKPWEEQKASLPAYPADRDLVRFEVGPTSPFEFFVDSTSVSVGKDGVVRYTLVARSPSGALNVSYEGIRCDARLRRLYAFGRSDRSWAQARAADWVHIPDLLSAPGNHQAVLADEFLCVRGSARSAEASVKALKTASRRLP